MPLAYFLQVDIYWCFVMQFRSCSCKKIFTFHFELKNFPFTQISQTFLSASVMLQSQHQLSCSLTAVLYLWASTSGSSKEMLCFHKIKCFFSFSRLFSADSPMFVTTNAFKQTFHFASNLSMSRSNHNL